MEFDGKAGVVTGSGSGIGRATAMEFAKRGGAVVVADINEETANSVAREIVRNGGKAVAIGADVTRDADIDAMIGLSTKQFGRLDFLHNNAFGLPPAPENEQAVTRTGDVPDSVWDKTIDVGLSAVFRTIKKAIPIMKAQKGGAIVNTASISGQYADYGIVAYNAAKAGIINLTRVVAVEYASDGIRCNCVCPGAIHTPLLEQSLVNPRIAEGFLKAIPLGRLGRPQDIANVVLFLGSDLAAFVTGAAFVADGGQTAKTGSPSFIPD
jgi:meso-butanediol dehydrogenase/(S,S)-butanediol dehydrogenase/diacetyl reductase